MDANHARPLAAFCLVAALAALVTSLGLREGASGVTVSAASPSEPTASRSPEVVLGGTLQPAPTIPRPASTLPSLSALGYHGATVEPVARATTVRTVSASPSTVRPGSTSSATTRPTRHRSSSSGGTTTAGATATARTAPGLGNGHAYGHGSAAPGHSASARGHSRH